MIESLYPARAILFVDAKLIDPEHNDEYKGSLLIENGSIAAISPDPSGYDLQDRLPANVERINALGCCLAPGLIDLRAELREPGFEHQETILSGTRAAVIGGITTLCAQPNTDPPVDNVALVEFVQRRAKSHGSCHVIPMAALTHKCEGQALTEMGLMAEAGAIAFTDVDRPIADTLLARQAMDYAFGINALIVEHPQDPSLIMDGVMNEGITATRLGLVGMPAAAEEILISRDLALARLTGARLHFGPVTTAAGLDLIRMAKKEGLRVSCDTTPSYFLLDETAVGAWRSFAKLNPPLRRSEDRQAVLAALADGTIDAVTSGHAPRDRDSKRLPFALAAFGSVGLESLLALLLETVRRGWFSLHTAIRLVTFSPAQCLGLKTGRLATGVPADLVQFDPKASWVLNSDTLRSKSKNTAFDGWTLQGRVVRTLLDGHVVYGPEVTP